MEDWIDGYVKFAIWRDKYRKEVIQGDKKCTCGKYRDDSYCEICANRWVKEILQKCYQCKKIINSKQLYGNWHDSCLKQYEKQRDLA